MHLNSGNQKYSVKFGFSQNSFWRAKPLNKIVAFNEHVLIVSVSVYAQNMDTLQQVNMWAVWTHFTMTKIYAYAKKIQLKYRLLSKNYFNQLHKHSHCFKTMP